MESKTMILFIWICFKSYLFACFAGALSTSSLLSLLSGFSPIHMEMMTKEECSQVHSQRGACDSYASFPYSAKIDTTYVQNRRYCGSDDSIMLLYLLELTFTFISTLHATIAFCSVYLVGQVWMGGRMYS